MIELIREQPKGPFFARKWWKINDKYTVVVSYEDSMCSVTVTDEENKSITDQVINNAPSVDFSVAKAPIGGSLIEIRESAVDDLLKEIERLM